MKRIVWLTDIHLNFLQREDVETFLERVAAAEGDGVLISGDVSEAHDVVAYLEQIDEALACPVYFVLGNHDFYFGSIATVRREVGELCRARGRLCYLTAGEVFELAPGIGLIGHDGWADARIGDYERSLVMMNDYKLIEELGRRQQARPLAATQGAGRRSGRTHPPRVAASAGTIQYDQVYLLTHVPPLREACWHEGQISDDEWAPHFTCRALGEAILDIMRGRDDKQLIVLCGHTHGEGETRAAGKRA